MGNPENGADGDRFDREVLDALDRTDEVHVGTRPDASSPVRETVIWAVVVDGGAFVRSVRGGKGRWYREATANPDVTFRVDDRRVPRRVPARAVPETDARTIEGVSGAIREKYGASYPGPAAAMLREEVLATTLRLIPA